MKANNINLIAFTVVIFALSSIHLSSARPHPQDATTEKSGGFRKYIVGLVMGTTTTTTTTTTEPTTTKKSGTFGIRKFISGVVHPSSTTSTTTTTEKSGTFGVRKYIAGVIMGSTTTTPKPTNIIDRTQNAYRDAKDKLMIITDPKKAIQKQISQAILGG